MDDRADRQDRQPDPEGVDEVRAHAARLGLPISDEDAARLVAGMRRMQAMAVEVRAVAGPEIEPGDPAVVPWQHRPRDGRPR